jgi:hypothetical protein
MEAHHPHHITQKKKWTEYLLEFLMLFLAVFLGFIAENIREHAVEHKRAKQYAKSLLSDLKNDVTELDRSAAFDNLTNLMIDSLVHFINKGVTKSNTGQFYYLSRLAHGLYVTDWNKATLNQLINSGNLRYFSNMELVNKINFYNTTSNGIVSLQQTIGTRRERSAPYSDQIFIPEWLLLYTRFSTDDILDGVNKHFIDSLKNVTPSLQTITPSVTNSFGNAILATKANREFLLNNSYPLARKSAVEIIELIKKEYHLKDD